MKIRRNFVKLATLTLCILSAFGTEVVVNTQPAKAEKACSNRSLYGVYQAQSQGYLNYTDPYALEGLLTYDGNGKVTTTILVRSIAGQITTNIPNQGTYQVNSDCSSTQTFTRADGTTASYSGTVYDNGNKYSVTQTDPGTIVTTRGEKIKNYNSSKACSNRSLYGVYQAQSQGYLNYTDPYALEGLLTYDGNGKITTTILVRSTAGQITTDLPNQGTYQVNSDCSFTQTFNRADGTTASYSGTVYDDGNKYSFTQTDPGTIVTTKGERVKNYNSYR